MHSAPAIHPQHLDAVVRGWKQHSAWFSLSFADIDVGVSDVGRPEVGRKTGGARIRTKWTLTGERRQATLLRLDRDAPRQGAHSKHSEENTYGDACVTRDHFCALGVDLLSSSGTRR